MPGELPHLPSCPRCSRLLDRSLYNRPAPVGCPGCDAELTVSAFPRLFEAVEEGAPAAALLASGEASCFDHANKQAVSVCDGCGRFLCSLCDMEFDGRHLCPACLATGVREEKIESLQRGRTRYDNVALATSVCSWFMTSTVIVPLIMAPATLFMVFKYWKKPMSPVEGSRVRFLLAFLLAAAQIVLGIWLLIVVIGG